MGVLMTVRLITISRVNWCDQPLLPLHIIKHIKHILVSSFHIDGSTIIFIKYVFINATRASNEIFFLILLYFNSLGWFGSIGEDLTECLQHDLRRFREVQLLLNERWITLSLLNSSHLIHSHLPSVSLLLYSFLLFFNLFLSLLHQLISHLIQLRNAHALSTLEDRPIVLQWIDELMIYQPYSVERPH